MAYYAALVSVVQLLKAINRPDHRYPNPILDKQQIHLSLYEKFNLLQELLEDYSPKGEEESADVLERRIRDAAYHAEDIIESQTSRLTSQQLEDLEKVKVEVDSIVEELMRIKVESHIIDKDLQLNSYISSDRGGEVSKVDAPSGQNTFEGFEEHLTPIKGQLCGQSSRLEVVSIVGMGGIGKTTWATKLFDDDYIVYYFHCRAWVTVSQHYHMRKVLLDIGNSMNILNEELSRKCEQALKEHIRRHLIGMKYFIIIDDIWDKTVWDELKMIFPDKSNGSRILITTRVSDVAVYAGNGSEFLHQMQFLNEEQSWTLLRVKVFAQEHYPEELEVIGKLIAKNCRGLPLAIVVVAGLLSKVSKIQHDWEEISKNVSSAILGNDEDFSKILSLSYKHLPHHLKPCFLYLGGFPEDYELSISKLIKLWVAEGFLKPIASKTLEEVGEEYFKDLVSRNLVLVTKKSFYGKFKCCNIHDLLRDLCSQRARYENFFRCLQIKDVLHQEHIRYKSGLYQTWEDPLFVKYIRENVSHVRSVLSFGEALVEGRFSSVASNCKRLRILDTTNVLSPTVANVIVEQLHLRYLAFGGSTIQIPPSISKLQNLDTLIVDEHSVISLPSEIWKMPQLKHVMFKDVRFPPIPYGEIRIIDGVPLLGRLQTLQRVKDFKFTSDTVKMVPCLKQLKVQCSYKPYENWEEFGLNNLEYLHQLERLEIYFPKCSKFLSPLPEKFAFPSTLIKLSLEGCRLPWKETRIVGSLPNLQILKLRYDAFCGEEWQPIEGGFPQLKFLLLYGLLDLKYWRAENTHFPCLEQLHIRRCLLEEIPSEIGEIPTLQFIEVHYSNSALELSALKIQEEQREQGNDDLQVRVVS